MDPQAVSDRVEERIVQRLRAEVEALRDERDRLAFLDDAAQPVVASWEQAHKHHADEPYIGCVFCRDKFVAVAEVVDALREGEEVYGGEFRQHYSVAADFIERRFGA